MLMVVAQVEDDINIKAQIAKQTVQPDLVYLHVDTDPAKGINDRRTRIAHNHQHLVEAVTDNKPDLVWQLEGDVDLPNDALERLLANYETLKGDDFGYVSGVQVGRHGIYCIGAWHVAKDKTKFSSVNHNEEGILPIDATGFYCLLAERDVWLSGKTSWADEPYGPDVVWGLSINKNKYVDMSLKIGHITNRGIIRPEHESTCNVEFKKDEAGKWVFKTW